MIISLLIELYLSLIGIRSCELRLLIRIIFISSLGFRYLVFRIKNNINSDHEEIFILDIVISVYDIVID